MTYEETPRKITQGDTQPITHQIKSSVKTLPKPKNKQEKIDMSKEQFEKAKADHKASIAKSKQDIKKYKLLMKQAKITYKLSKMKG